MILACPSCKRKFKIIEEYRGKLVRCKCQSLLKVPGVFSESNTPPPAISKEEKKAATPSKNSSDEVGIWVELVYPQLNQTFDLSKWQGEVESIEEAPATESVEEVEMPSFDDEVPSFDDDFDEDISDDDIEDLAAFNDNIEEQEEELTSDQTSSLAGINIQEEFPLDPRVIPALKDLESSEDPQFIVDFLFYLLEVRRLEIKETVEKFVDNKNPLSSYYATRILENIADLEKEDSLFKKDQEPVNTKVLFASLFKGNRQEKTRAIERSIDNRSYASVPYIMTQLLLEQDEDVILLILNRVGLMSEQKEVDFFAKFLQSRVQSVKLAAIEGLGCIGGDNVIPYLIASLVDRDMAIVAAINEALKSSDKDDIAKQILSYLMSHDVFDKKGYIRILQENGTVNALRAIAWLLSDPKVGVTALESIKEMEVAEEEKVAILQEFLNLSYEDSPFDNDLITVLEAYNTNFDRSRLVPVNVFDDSYVSLVRLSPLFERDFAVDDEDSVEVAELIEVEVIPFKLGQYITNQIDEVKQNIEKVQLHLKVKTSLPLIATHIFLYAFVIFLSFTALFKGLGKTLTYIPGFFPKQFTNVFGSRLFVDPAYIDALYNTFLSSTIAIFLAFLLGSAFAISQLKSDNQRIRILPILPLLIPSILLGFNIGIARDIFVLDFSLISLILAYLFPAISIYYLSYMRFFQFVPRSQYDLAIQLGANQIDALKITYGPSFQMATMYATLLSYLYAFATVGMTSYIHSDHSLGYILFSKLEYFEGWLMLGTYLSVLAIAIILAGLLLELILPIYSLFPSSIDRNMEQTPVHQNFRKSLMIWGVLFYKSRNKKDKSKKNEDNIEAKNDSIENSDEEKPEDS
ncbi:hypothetical protein MJH12_05070 [bacterium]|nr:hypothetical protein [bacterium]